MKTEQTKDLLKMSQLARLSGVNVTTIQYYVKEGLVDIALKTGPNMAYYRPDSVERVKRIKMLQSEKYYPLAVIRRLIASGELDSQELELLDVIHKTGRENSTLRYSFAKALSLSGLSRSQGETLIGAGVITPEGTGKTRQFRESDVKMMQLVKTRLEAGIPFQQTLKSFKVYTDMLEQAAVADIEHLIGDTFLTKAHDTHSIVRIIRTSDETLNEFIMLKRYEFNSIVGTERIAALGRFAEEFGRYLGELAALLMESGYRAEAERLSAALETGGDKEPALAAAVKVLQNSGRGLALSLAACTEANKVIRAVSAEDSVLARCVRLGWISLCPGEFAPSEEGEGASLQQEPIGDAALTKAVSSLLHSESPKP